MSELNLSGPHIQHTRQIKRVTQEELAARLCTLGWDVDRFIVSKIERGERQVTDKELLMLAEALDVSPSVLLGNP